MQRSAKSAIGAATRLGNRLKWCKIAITLKMTWGRPFERIASIFVVPFIAAGITRAASRMDSNGIEKVRSSIAQWLFDFMAGDICRVALYAARSFICFLYVVNPVAGCLSRQGCWRLAFRDMMR